ncbi:hypothetical protein PsalMR5_01623 [Piscirickettsia salmonis]|uniref:hypothetical protein n=1 Tax=Piscirickettsia salmonis TaxID=1238 RepID=UPI0012BAAAE2|nr:hypothetical protein [Piscirickettsia salmonis]QGP54182.1 hypothetical protein PsalSR1_01614 [Piscirickettsia salmonis]QGP59922.1 hypothetical protein PsalBI1_02519 [Piscirickettsia salmonis]QGP63759.1 hypothetical protein PsalMR5_01623 [Piscirickettsia salmonis]
MKFIFAGILPNYNKDLIFEALIRAIYDGKHEMCFIEPLNGSKNKNGIKRLIHNIIKSSDSYSQLTCYASLDAAAGPGDHTIYGPNDYSSILQKIDPLPLTQTDDEHLHQTTAVAPDPDPLHDLHLQPEETIASASPIRPDNSLPHPLSPSAEPSDQIATISALITERDDEEQPASDQAGIEAFELIDHPDRPSTPSAESPASGPEPEIASDFAFPDHPATRTSSLLLEHFMSPDIDEAPPALGSAPSYE